VRTRRAAFILTCLLASSALIQARPPDQSEPQPPAVVVALRERAAFGLNAEAGTVSRLLHSSADVGSSKWGMPLTGEEEAALDLQGRMMFVHDVGVELLPFVRGLPAFAGAYVDQRDDGALVVLLTERDRETEQRILALRPAVDRGVGIRYVSHTYAKLREAAFRAWARWPAHYPEVRVRSVALDTMNNRIRLRLDTPPRLLDPDRVRAVRDDLGVAFTMDSGAGEASVACPGAAGCIASPQAGGIIHRGAPGGPRCTIGFHIRVGPHDEFLTSGHCGHGGAMEWYHDGTLVGRQIASLYQQNGYDVMRVRLVGRETSALLHGQWMPVIGADQPIQGQVVCASLGRSERVDCGVVSAEWVSWTDGICQCTSWGADVDGMEIRQGDSGSPIYQLDGGGGAIAIGIVSTTSGKFALVVSALARWGATIGS
jgi:hypothetical protein